MLWFFRREQQTTTIELRFEEALSEFVLTVTPQEGEALSQRFSTYEAFAERVGELERHLAGDGWRQEGPPFVLPTGWRTTHRRSVH